MKSQLITGISCLALVLVRCPSAAQSARLTIETADSLAASGADVVSVADAYSAAWAHDRAISTLDASGRGDAAILWRKARSLIDIGENLNGDAALAKYDAAKSLAEQALQEQPENPDIHQTLAVVYGRIALFKGIFKSAGLAKQVYRHAHRALALNDSMPRSLYILGRLHGELSVKPGVALKLMGLGWAQADSVTHYYDQALAVNPNLIQTRVTYAEFLLGRKGDTAEAVRLLQEALSLPVVDEQDQAAQKNAELLLGRYR